MTLPKWNSPGIRVGTMIRTALWLVTEVGVGNVFTKELHRLAFAGIAQADRRLRDLREYGWVIHTSLEDLTLNRNEQRLVTVGLPVWERGIRKLVLAENVTSKKRMATFAENDYQCAVCGIAGGEVYPDAPQVSAVLSISRRKVKFAVDHIENLLITECKRCRAGTEAKPLEIAILLSKFNNLDATDKSTFIRWAAHGRRGELDSAWGEFRRLSKTLQEEVLMRLKGKN